MHVQNAGILKKMQSRIISRQDFDFDNLSAPPLYSLMSQYNIDQLYNIASSVRYASNPTKKFNAIETIMKPLGFVKLAAGTNRIAYKHLEIPSIIVKVAEDKVAIKDSPQEFINQLKIKPFNTKIFEVSPDGAVGLFERVQPITSREEFASFADDVFQICWMLTKNYILADFGSHYFMNWGLREGFGPVLLDFPYVYEPDGSKLICSAPRPDGTRCGGLIDYDEGFNNLVCNHCGARYRAVEIGKLIEEKKIVREGEKKVMKITLSRGNQTISKPEDNMGMKPAATVIPPMEELLKKSPYYGPDSAPIPKFPNPVQQQTVTPAVETPQSQPKPVQTVKQVTVKPVLKTQVKPQVNSQKQKPTPNKKHNNNHGGVNVTAITFDQLKDLTFTIDEIDMEHGLVFLSSGIAKISLKTSIFDEKFFDTIAPDRTTEYGNEELENTKSDLIMVEEEIEKLRAVKSQLEAKLASANAEMADMRKENQDLKKKLEEVGEDESTKERLKRAQEVQKKLQEEDENNKKIISELQRKLTDLTNNSDAVNGSDNDAEERINKLQETVNSLRAELDNQKKINEEYDDELNEYEKLFQAQDDKLRSIQDQMDSYDDTEEGKSESSYKVFGSNIYKLKDFAEFYNIELEENAGGKIIVIKDTDGGIICDGYGDFICIESINGYKISDLKIFPKDGAISTEADNKDEDESEE